MKVDELVQESIVESPYFWREGPNEWCITFDSHIMMPGAWEGLKRDLAKTGVSKREYQWNIAMGDTHPHAVTMTNKFLMNAQAVELVRDYEGPSPYDGDGDDDESEWEAE